ncbi:hypothetical protein EGW08_000559 [Elysia chlorotica]|uniref:Uncharacterized protein n=1 Tax=Elysia chlorotica TaxID=188477 RepID=A0A433UDD5_ELYCH|nr:hypothetical protein EGW08_000559 [Elysia chlorotica]
MPPARGKKRKVQKAKNDGPATTKKPFVPEDAVADSVDGCSSQPSHAEQTEHTDKNRREQSVKDDNCSNQTNTALISENATDPVAVYNNRDKPDTEESHSQVPCEEMAVPAVSESSAGDLTRKDDVTNDSTSLTLPEKSITDHKLSEISEVKEALTGEEEKKSLEKFDDEADEESLQSHSEDPQDFTCYVVAKETRCLGETFLSASQPVTSNRTSNGISAYEKLAKRFKPPPRKAGLTELDSQPPTSFQSKDKNQASKIDSQNTGVCFNLNDGDTRANIINPTSDNTYRPNELAEIDTAKNLDNAKLEADEGGNPLGSSGEEESVRNKTEDVISSPASTNNMHQNCKPTIYNFSEDHGIQTRDNENQYQDNSSFQCNEKALEKSFTKSDSHSDQSKSDGLPRVSTPKHNQMDQFLGPYELLSSTSTDDERKKPSLENMDISEPVLEVSLAGTQGFIASNTSGENMNTPLSKSVLKLNISPVRTQGFITGNSPVGNLGSSGDIRDNKFTMFDLSPITGSVSKMYDTKIDSNTCSMFGATTMSRSVTNIQRHGDLSTFSPLPDDSINFKPEPQVTTSLKQRMHDEAVSDHSCFGQETPVINSQTHAEEVHDRDGDEPATPSKQSPELSGRADCDSTHHKSSTTSEPPEPQGDAEAGGKSNCHMTSKLSMKYPQQLDRNVGHEEEIENCPAVNTEITLTSDNIAVECNSTEATVSETFKRQCLPNDSPMVIKPIPSNISDLSTTGTNLSDASSNNCETSKRNMSVISDKKQITNIVTEGSTKHTSSPTKEGRINDTSREGRLESRNGEGSNVKDDSSEVPGDTITEAATVKKSPKSICDENLVPPEKTLQSHFESSADSFINKLSFSNLFSSLSPTMAESSDLTETNGEMRPAEDTKSKNKFIEREGENNAHSQYKKLSEINQDGAETIGPCIITHGKNPPEAVKKCWNPDSVKSDPGKEATLTTVTQPYAVSDYIQRVCEDERNTAEKQSLANVLDEIQNSMTDIDFCDLDSQIFLENENMEAEAKQQSELDKFESEFQTNQASAVEHVNMQRSEGISIVKTIMEDLVSINRQMMKMKKEMDIVSRSLGRLGKQDDRSKTKGSRHFGGR